jgi:hypothetical protein
MLVEARNDAEILFVCPEDGCGRRLVLKSGGGLVIIDQGDFYARHVGGLGTISVDADVTQ